MKKLIIILILILPIVAFGGSAILLWDAPIQYIDEAPLALTDIGAYTIYTGQPLNSLITLLTSTMWPSSALMSYTIISLPVGTNYFAITATDVNGYESAISNIQTKYISAPLNYRSSFSSWLPPTTFVDGNVLNPITDLAGYNIYCGSNTCQNSYETVTYIVGGSTTTAELNIYFDKPYCVITAVTTTLLGGKESDCSNEIKVNMNVSSSPDFIIN